MAVRLYDRPRGRFLEVDPVEGGSANDYDYCWGDAVNCFDLGGDAAHFNYPSNHEIQDIRDCDVLWRHIQNAKTELKSRDDNFRTNWQGFEVGDKDYRGHEKRYDYVQGRLTALLERYEELDCADGRDEWKLWALANKEHAKLGHPGVTYEEFVFVISQSYAQSYAYFG